MMKSFHTKINTKDTITALGEMTMTFAKEMFTEIEIEVKKIEREQKNASKGDVNHEQTGLNHVGENAAGIPERVQPDGIPQTDGAERATDALHRNPEPNAGLHREHEEPDNSAPNSAGDNARQGGKPAGMGTGDERDRADSQGNSNQGIDRGQPIAVEPNTEIKVDIAALNAYNPAVCGKPWVSAVSRGRNFFTTNKGEPIGGYTGDTAKGEGGRLYVLILFSNKTIDN